MVYDVYGTTRPTTEAGAVRRCKLIQREERVFVAPSRSRFDKHACYELLLPAMDHKRGERERKETSSTALVVSALAPLVMDQVTSLRERSVTECILRG